MLTFGGPKTAPGASIPKLTSIRRIVAGSQKLVDALLASEKLEVYQLEPTDKITYDSDTLNPPPDDPYGGSFKIG